MTQLSHARPNIPKETICPRDQERFTRSTPGSDQRSLSAVPFSHVHANGLTVAYREVGPPTGLPLIMLTAYGCQANMWDPEFIAELARTRRVLMPDYVGVGKSHANGKARYRHSVGSMAGDVHAFMEAKNLRQADLLGWSLGAYVAMQLAREDPDAVHKLVLYGGDVGGTKAVFPGFKVLGKLVQIVFANLERYKRLAASLLFPHDWVSQNPAQTSYMPTITSRPPLRTMFGQFVACMFTWNEFGKLGGISNDTLVVTGDQDIVAPPGNADILAAEIPSARIAVISGGGHGLMYQYPHTLAGVVSSFLDSSA